MPDLMTMLTRLYLLNLSHKWFVRGHGPDYVLSEDARWVCNGCTLRLEQQPR